MLRVVRSPEGCVSVDAGGKSPGRGAYICAARECLALAKKKNALARSLKIQTPREIYEELEKYCAE
jgi:predicted RNA-binding protein YlxR (DUF448 family)